MLTCESKILLMQRLQDYARLDYRFYFQGEVGLEKLNSLSRKFAQQYDTELSKFQRARRKRSGEAVTQLLIWIPEDSDKARFWLMATEGKGRVHEYETLRNAILARNDLLYGVAVASLYQSPGFRLVRRQVGMLARWLRMEWGKLRKEPMPELPTFLAYVRRLPNPVAKTRRKVQDSTRQQVAESEPA